MNPYHFHPFYFSPGHQGIAIIGLCILVGMLACLVADTRSARAVLVGAVLLLVLMLCGCSEAPIRPADAADAQHAPSFCERHSQGCVITGGTIAVAAVFATMAMQPAHHRDPGDSHGAPGTPCIGDQCIH